MAKNNKKAIRGSFRDSVLKRDHYSCKLCYGKNDLEIHHIIPRNTLPNGGYIEENGIALCPSCHEYAESYYTSNGKNGPTPESLLYLIGSSRKLVNERLAQ